MEETINDRIKKVISDKSKNKKEFAESLGWSQSYLSKVLTGNIGLSPIKEILQRYKDIDGRWLILGEGYIYGSVEANIISNLSFMLSLQQYIPYMSDTELNNYYNAVSGRDVLHLNSSNIENWKKMELEKDKSLLQKVSIDNISDKDLVDAFGKIALKKKTK